MYTTWGQVGIAPRLHNILLLLQMLSLTGWLATEVTKHADDDDDCVKETRCCTLLNERTKRERGSIPPMGVGGGVCLCVDSAWLLGKFLGVKLCCFFFTYFLFEMCVSVHARTVGRRLCSSDRCRSRDSYERTSNQAAPGFSQTNRRTQFSPTDCVSKNQLSLFVCVCVSLFSIDLYLFRCVLQVSWQFGQVTGCNGQSLRIIILNMQKNEEEEEEEDKFYLTRISRWLCWKNVSMLFVCWLVRGQVEISAS